MLVAILPLQLNECLRVACGLCLDVILLPVLGNLIPLSLALLHQVEGKVAIVLTCLGSSVGKQRRHHGIDDLDNCYCSSEKVFRPDLEGKPIVVLSNLFGILNKLLYS